MNSIPVGSRRLPMNIQLTNATLVAVCSALTLSSWFVCGFLIRRHFQEFSQRTIQLLILYIIVFPPLYSLESVLSIAFPSVAIYLAILLDCYMSYCLYAFFLLMMNMLGCEEDDFKLVAYLETKTSFNLGFPLNVLCSKDLARGKAFLLYCRSGILQLCVLKPLVTLTSLVLNQLHLYNEFSTSFTEGYLYLLILLNVSVIYAFAALAAFYTVFKMKLKPFHASKKFTWIICVVFFTFWQDVIVTGIVQAGVMSDLGTGSTPLVSTRIQDLLICIEMLLASIACWWIFSYEPYTSGYVNPYDYSDYDEEVDVYERSGRPGAVGANYRYSMLNTDGGEVEEGRTKKGRSSNRSNSSRKPVTSSISGGKATLEFTDPSRMPAAMDRGMTSSGGENDGGASGESSGGKGKIAKKLKSLRGPSDMLRRFSGGSSGASRLTATTAVVANKPPEAKVELLPNTGGPSEYTTAKTNRTKKPEVAVAMSKASFVIEGEEEDEEEAGKNQPPPFQNSATDELPEDVMLLLGAKKGRVGAAATTAEVARDLNDFGQDGEVAPGSTVLRSIQSRYADTEYEVDVNRSSLSSITNNDISGLVNGAIEVGNPLLESQQQNAAEAEEAAVSSWAGKSMKERAASMEQRLVDQSGASSSSSSPRVNVIKKTVTVTKKTKKHHHHNSSQQSQSSAASQSVDKG